MDLCCHGLTLKHLKSICLSLFTLDVLTYPIYSAILSSSLSERFSVTRRNAFADLDRSVFLSLLSSSYVNPNFCGLISIYFIGWRYFTRCHDKKFSFQSIISDVPQRVSFSTFFFLVKRPPISSTCIGCKYAVELASGARFQHPGGDSRNTKQFEWHFLIAPHSWLSLNSTMFCLFCFFDGPYKAFNHCFTLQSANSKYLLASLTTKHLGAIYYRVLFRGPHIFKRNFV